jgi:hypothetical protein
MWCHEFGRKVEHRCGNTASMKRRRMPGGTIVALGNVASAPWFAHSHLFEPLQIVSACLF